MPLRRIAIPSLVAAIAFPLPVPVCRGAPAPEAIDLAGYLPGHTVALLRVDVGSLAHARFPGGIRAILEDPEIRPALEPLLGLLYRQEEEALDYLEQQIGISRRDWPRFFGRGRTTVALTNLDLSGKKPLPIIILAVDFPGSDDDARGLIEAISSWLGNVSDLPVQVSGRPGRTYRVSVGKELTVTIRRIGGSLVASTSADALRRIARHHRRGTAPENPLPTQDAYRTSHERMGGDRSPGFIYLNVNQLQSQLSLLSQKDPSLKGLSRFNTGLLALNIFGLNSLESIAVGEEPLRRGSRVVAYLHFPSGRAGIFGIPGEERANLELLRHAPRNAFLAAASGRDWKGAYKRFLDILDIAPAGSQVRGPIEKLEKDLGISFAEDLLAGFGAHGALWGALPPEGGLLPYWVHVAEMRDVDRFKRTVARVADRLGGSTRTLPYRGNEIHIVEIPAARSVGTLLEMLGFPSSPPEEGGLLRIDEDVPEPIRKILGDPHVTLCYLVEDNLLFHASSPLALKWQIDHDGGSILDDPVFVRSTEGRTDDVGAIVYIRIHAAAKWLYNTAIPVAQFLVGSSLKRHMDIDLARLPTAEFLDRRIDGLVCTFSADPKGMCLSASGPGGSQGMLAATSVTALAAGFLVPTLTRARLEARHVKCTSKLREISRVAAVYADAQRSGVFPHDPEGGVKPFQIIADFLGEDFKPEWFICPHSVDEVPAERDASGRWIITDANTSYRWTTKRLKTTDRGPWILLYCKRPHPNGKRCAAFADGSVREFTEEEFTKALDEMTRALEGEEM